MRVPREWSDHLDFGHAPGGEPDGRTRNLLKRPPDPRTAKGGKLISATDPCLTLDAQNPWPGLAAYDEASRDFFHGREGEAEELLRLTKLAPLTVLYGRSGLGKSSLLQAALFPPLRQEHYLPVYIRLIVSENVPPLEQAAQRLHSELMARKPISPHSNRAKRSGIICTGAIWKSGGVTTTCSRRSWFSISLRKSSHVVDAIQSGCVVCATT